MDIRNLFKFKKDYIIGLDIGSSAVKMAQFKDTEGGLRLIKAELKELPYTADKELKEKETLNAIKYLLKGIDIKRSNVIAAMNCPQTAIKKITAPYMPKSELREGIMLESKNYFPFPIDASTLDYEILGDLMEKGVRKYEVMVGVCPLETVNRTLSLLNHVFVRPVSLISSSYALQKIASRMSKNAEETQCFIDIGAVYTELVICKGSILVFSRKIPVSGNDFTMAMTSALVSDKGTTQMTETEAEKVKREVGIPSDGDTRIIDNSIPAQQILGMLRQPAEHLVNEISRCFDYYREESSSGRISSVTVFGGGSSLTNLVKFMSDTLGITVTIGDPLEGLKMEKDAVTDRGGKAHRLELAVGAVLSSWTGVNLLPPELKEQTKKIIKRGTAEAVITAVVIVSLLFFIGMKIKISNFNKRILSARQQLSILGPQIKDAEARRVAEMALTHEPYWEDVFKELGALIHDNIIIDSMKMESGSMFMKGQAASPDGQEILSSFIIALEKGLFNKVKLIESKNLPDSPGIEFQLKCWIDYED